MSREAWSAYWQSGATRGCLPGASEAVQQALADAWRRFAEALPQGASVLDLACGTGAVMQAMAAARPDLRLTGVDSADVPSGSSFAIMPRVDCAALPFPDAGFAAVTSQYGLEYCPPQALDEAVRMLASEGRMQLLIHSRNSAPIRHNAGRLAAMQAMDAAGLFRLARQAVAGVRDPALAAALAVARAAHASQGIAAELPMALDQALRAPRPLERIAGIEARARNEMARLSAMVEAAQSAAEIEALVQRLRASAVAADAKPLTLPSGESLGWLVNGRKTGA